MPSRRLAIIGGDAAGMSAASIARRRDPDLEIVAFERGAYTSYSACGIPYYVGGLVEHADRLISRSPAAHRDNGIDVRTGLRGRRDRPRCTPADDAFSGVYDPLLIAARATAKLL